MRTNDEHSMSANINTILTLVLLLVASSVAHSQPFPAGLGVEIGGGYNQLFFSVPAQYVPANSSTEFNRTDLFVTPAVRLTYRWNLTPWLEVTPFVGYDQFGGKTKLGNGYEDQFQFDAVESGLYSMYPIGDFSLGLALKANYHLKVTARYFGYANQTSVTNATWREKDVSDWYTRWSGDLGGRVSYQYQNFSLSLDGWFGITHLQHGVNSLASIRSNQYRVFLGYTL